MELVRLIGQMLEKRREDRPESYREITDRLVSVLRASGAAVSTPTRPLPVPAGPAETTMPTALVSPPAPSGPRTRRRSAGVAARGVRPDGGGRSRGGGGRRLVARPASLRPLPLWAALGRLPGPAALAIAGRGPGDGRASRAGRLQLLARRGRASSRSSTSPRAGPFRCRPPPRRRSCRPSPARDATA